MRNKEIKEQTPKKKKTKNNMFFWVKKAGEEKHPKREATTWERIRAASQKEREKESG